MQWNCTIAAERSLFGRRADRREVGSNKHDATRFLLLGTWTATTAPKDGPSSPWTRSGRRPTEARGDREKKKFSGASPTSWLGRKGGSR